MFTPTQHKRLNEVMGVLFLAGGILALLSFASFRPADSSWNTVTGRETAENLIGPVGAFVADLFLQGFGLAAFLLPILMFGLGWKWIRSEALEAPWVKVPGAALMVLSACGLAAMLPEWRLFDQTILPGGAVGFLLSGFLRHGFNSAGAAVLMGTCLIISTYLVSTFTLAVLWNLLAPIGAFFVGIADSWRAWRQRSREAALERTRLKGEAKAEAAAMKGRRRVSAAEPVAEAVSQRVVDTQIVEVRESAGPPIVPQPEPAARSRVHSPMAPQPANAAQLQGLQPTSERLPWDDLPPSSSEFAGPESTVEVSDPGDIPIRRLDDIDPPSLRGADEFPFNKPLPKPREAATKLTTLYRLPSTTLLNEIPQRSAFDEQELKNTAAAIKSKFEEFNVLGSVVQINPGPVVTTFEFKPEAGIKYSRITTLTEDLCLGLQAESILIERIPGKPTVGIEVPNTKREVISLRAVLESEEFESSPSRLTISMGKDINGRIKVATLETMPHLLIAGSTGSGKSVMINSLIMSILYKSTPDEVRMIMVDPKRVELGMYEGIPHLLTPVITDPRKATNALKNAVLEMERRLRLLAEQGARNIDQYNKKILSLRNQPRSLFEDETEEPQKEELRPLPYILILIDELADLMMLEGKNVEESVTRLAQMARAVGMHLVLATQRPSVDVITGIIKANFPARISFRVATRVDSRTILDVMGSEHLLGKGDMLFLPPGSSRLTRVHGAFVTETEISGVVDFWKAQAKPEYDQSYLIAPPTEDGEGTSEEVESGEQDPMYEEAMRVVLEMGKASTSTLQRRLRLGYGRAARILDMMYKDGVIGPPDGSKPREVLKRPDWLREVDHA
jgi:S-DNA-T family DNA segregation ATPase FtsK/SpoIIIE